MEITDVQPNSSPAAIETREVSIPTGEAYTQWRKTGEFPEAKPQPNTGAPAASSETTNAADPEDSPTSSSESAAAPETATTQEQAPKKGTAESRIKELLAENKKLKSQIETRPPEATRAAESSPVKAEPRTAPTEPKEPDLKDFKTAEEWDVANRKYVRDYANYIAAKAVEDYKSQTAQEVAARELNEKIEAGRKRYDNLDSVIVPVATQILNDQQIAPAIKALIEDSPVMVDLLYVMGNDQGELAGFLKLARSNPAAALRQVVLMEQMVSEELSGDGKGTGSDKTTETANSTEIPERDPKTGKFTAPAAPAKKITSAPGPTHEVNATGTAPPDEAMAALERGDIATYNRLENAADLKRRKAGRKV